MKGSTKKNALKRAWALYRKSKKSTTGTTSKSKSKSRSSKGTSSRSVRKTARQFKIPMALTAGIALTSLGKGPGAPGGQSTIEHLQRGEYKEALYRFGANWTGYDMGQGKWSFDFLNIWPTLIGAGISYGASKLGLNRRLRLPLVKI